MNDSAFHSAIRAACLAAALLLPVNASPDSQVETSAGASPVSAVAHVNFKIVIPRVLSLNVEGDGRAHLASNSAARKPFTHPAVCAPYSASGASPTLLCTASMP